MYADKPLCNPSVRIAGLTVSYQDRLLSSIVSDKLLYTLLSTLSTIQISYIYRFN